MLSCKPDVFIPVFSSNHNPLEVVEIMILDVFIPVFSSNHNGTVKIQLFFNDVFIPVFSSNHNERLELIRLEQMSLFPFFHQTTTLLLI